MKKKVSMIKRLIVTFIAAGTILSCQVVTGYAAQTLYEQVTSSKLVKGVTYDNKQRLTDEGWLNIHIITIDLNNSNISVSPIVSNTETGLRETVSKLLQSNGAIGGVNSGYFGMTGNYSAAFGPHIADGEILSMDADKNISKNQFGTFFTDESGKAYFEYFKTDLEFYADGNSYFEVAGMNTITQMVYPVYIDRNAMSDTKKLDERFGEITKIVVEDGRIVKISAKGENVEIPENGYIIALSSGFANVYLDKFAVGQSAEFKINTIFDTDKINTAISGGGVILKNGSKPNDFGEMALGRNPRTLLGISKDESIMKLIVAEGQRSGGGSTSIGLTVDEAVNLLKEEGMYNGLNLDGGGSSMMAIKASDSNDVKSVAKPAENTERPVVSAVGIFDSSEIGEITELVIKPSSDSVLAGSSLNIEVFGYDENYHKIQIPSNEVVLKSDSDVGNITGLIFNAKKIGTASITAEYKDLKASTNIRITDLESIVPENRELKLKEGQSVELKVRGLSSDGNYMALNGNISYSSTIGSIEGKTFKADKAGVGYIKCSYNGLETYIKVSIGTTDSKISSFEDVKYLDYSSYPADINGIAGISKANFSDGKQALGLSYNFKTADYTQASYLSFPKAIQINGEPVSLKLDVKGNGIGQWVRAKIVDAVGTEKVIDFSRDVNWTDWKTVSAAIPSDVKYPISVKTIYVAALNNKVETTQAMYFDNLVAEMPIDLNIDLPKDVKKPSQTEGSTKGKEEGFTYLNFSGNVTGAINDKNLYTSSRIAVNNALGKDSDFAVFGGSNDISTQNQAKVLNWQEGYKVYENNGVTLINMFAKNGGLRNTLKDQWTTFKKDAVNTKNNNIIIFMDKGPDYFTDAQEAALFRSALKDVADSGKKVYVLYANTSAYSSVYKEGVRYISLPNLWTADGKINSNYKVVRFKANNNSIVFEALDLF